MPAKAGIQQPVSGDQGRAGAFHPVRRLL